MPVKDVEFNPEVILRRFLFHKIGGNFQKMRFFKNCSKATFKENSKELLFF